MPVVTPPDQVVGRQPTSTRSLSTRGLRQRKRVLGHPRKFSLNIKITAQLYFGLLKVSKLKHRTMSVIAEDALWEYLSRLSNSGKVVERLRHASSLVTEVVITASKLPLQEQKGPVDVHERKGRQDRRNDLSEKTNAATSQVYELAQSEKLAEENQLRGSMYAILAHLTTVNELILRDAAEEEILAEIDKLRQEQRDFEENTRQLEVRTADKV